MMLVLKRIVYWVNEIYCGGKEDLYIWILEHCFNYTYAHFWNICLYTFDKITFIVIMIDYKKQLICLTSVDQPKDYVNAILVEL